MNLTLGHYVLKEKIADGGMGEVFKAIKKGTLGFEKNVVLKKLLPFYADNENLIRMLTAEAKISSNLDHPNIVQTIDFIKTGGDFYLVMEYVFGVDLGQIILKSKKNNFNIEPFISLFIISEVLKGLKYAHNFYRDGKPLKIIHRDISPQNILISYDGIVKIADFGIALSVLNEIKTKSGELKGKANYMSPEQIRREEIDERADFFSTSVVLYELLYGKRPFQGGSEFETMKNIAESDSIPDFPDIPGIMENTIKIVKRGLVKNKNERYQISKEFLEEILEIIPKDVLNNAHEKLKTVMNGLFPTAERTHKPIEKTPLLIGRSPALEAKVEKSLIPDEVLDEPLFLKKSSKFLPKLIITAVTVIILAFGTYIFFQQRTILRQKGEQTSKPITTQREQIPNVQIRQDTVEKNAKTISKKTPQAKPIIKNTAMKNTGIVSINSHPWSKIYINGKEIGETPINKMELEAGEYILNMVFSTGENIIKKIKITKNSPTAIFEKLPKK